MESIRSAAWDAPHPAGATFAHVGKTHRPASVPIKDAMAVERSGESRSAGGKKVRQCACRRPERADDGIDARRKRRDAGEPPIAECGRNNAQIGFAAQRPQRRSKGWRWDMMHGDLLFPEHRVDERVFLP
jgi:hypothetical protein